MIYSRSVAILNIKIISMYSVYTLFIIYYHRDREQFSLAICTLYIIINISNIFRREDYTNILKLSCISIAKL